MNDDKQNSDEKGGINFYYGMTKIQSGSKG